MDKQHKVNLLIWVLLFFLLLAAVLMLVKFVLGQKILTAGRRNIDTILKSLNEENQLKLNSPVFKTSDPTKGQPGADNNIFIFNSFTCSFCRQQADVLDQLEKKYPDKVFIVWKDLAAPLDLTARTAAVAARCAQTQDKFWQFHDYLYTNQDDLTEETYPAIAKQLNLDLDQFNQCLDSQEVLLLIESDIEEAAALGIDATPYLFINGQRNSGALTLDELEKKLNLKK
jgi:protein-disulfide isomerase